MTTGRTVSLGRFAWLVLGAMVTLIACDETPQPLAPKTPPPAAPADSNAMTMSMSVPANNVSTLRGGTYLSAPVSLPPSKPRAPSSTETSASLPPNATFRDVIRLARGASLNADSCILAGGTQGHAGQIRAPLIARPSDLEDPPDDLDEMLRRRAGGTGIGVNLRAPWGSIATQYDFDLVALTPASRSMQDALVVVIVVTNQGYWGLHAGMMRQKDNTPPMGFDELSAWIKTETAAADAWIVTAEGDAPVTMLRRALGAVPKGHGSVVLASPLAHARPADNSIVNPWLKPGDVEACPNGAEPTPSPIDAPTQSAAVQVIAAAIQPCVDLVPNEGGRVNLQVRISPRGEVDSACVGIDKTFNESMRSCMVGKAKGLSLGNMKTSRGVVMELVATLPGPQYDGLCDP